ncbi:FMN-binding glutamate synthase family protein [Parahaliea sp. F7430]|uniref:FMN-binding glutamate synthase family protein n=1 Tax=Sediminihaliea albiluteola TaxID=2758564 RepID=A0A7W2TXH5_9GAMM|nr:FMN-binding glutamate synthase family protein [Sediminihaliea albiluteola]MBA6413730.1 FMN-binding glutamate synthase family protein [Sediminihaliea albiluteola]
MTPLQQFTIGFLGVSSVVIALLIVGLIGVVLWMYVTDIRQTRHSIRRNYPVIGRFRYFFEHMGEFFRQYFFALDREELPFNRAQRTWVYRAAKNVDSTVAFGSTQPLNTPGDFLFLNSLFPPLEEEVGVRSHISFGDGFARTPYSSSSFFNISAMSYGALSAPAVSALSRGARKAGIWLNTGEGGISPFHYEGGCDIVFQIGTAKYGVRDAQGRLSDERLREIASHEQVRMFEIKLSQGAKPGKGGILPGNKVTDVIASTRGIPAGEDSISPNRHREIHNINDLLHMIHHVREVSGKPVGIKAAIGQIAWLDEFCQRIHELGLEYAPDFFTIDSADGGSGAAPQSLIDLMGLPVRRSLPLVVDKLIEYGLRERIRVICSGKMINPSGVAAALCLGADCVNSARGFMFALGCIQALQCNKNTCPTGVTTHDPDLQQGLDPTDKAERVANYAKNLMHEVEIIAHSCGVAEPRLLNRSHAQIISEQGLPEPLSNLYPDKETQSQYRH